jgi:hypothetical protein
MSIKIDDLTLGQIKQIQQSFNPSGDATPHHTTLGKKVIVRTYSAGVHYGEVVEKEGNEVILKNARRLFYWKTTNKGISLSEIANHGVHSDSKVCEPVNLIWLQPIEIIFCSDEAIKSIEGANVYKA